MPMTAVLSVVLTQVVEHPFYIFFELVFAAALTILLLQTYGKKKKKNKSKEVAVEMPSLEEQERRIAQYRSQMFRDGSKPTSNTVVPNGLGMTEVDSRDGCHITVRDGRGGSSRRCLDLATEDFHSFSTHPAVVEVARNAVMAYGVGSCGPRGFYGTIKPHMDAEKDIAKFLNVDDAIIYSFSSTTVATLISCYAGRGEHLIMDDGVHLAIADGCTLSRANVGKYRHNDMAQLETLLKDVAAKEIEAKKISRRFVVTEGLFKSTGDICNLPKILELCEKYKFRIILEDSYGFGCLGATGRGTHEHFGIPTSRIDVYVGSLSTALGAVGGFCAGEKSMIDYQRLGASAYVFSASLPPYVTSAASAALTLLDEDNSYPRKVRDNAKFFRQALRQANFNAEKIRMMECEGDMSPIVVLRPTDAYVRDHPQKVEEEIEQVVRAAREKDVLVLRHIYDTEEKCEHFPALRILIKGKAAKEDLQNAVTVIIEAVKTVFP
ncbi:putative serine-palmitoyl-CoA transferase [Trypanosoma grayi]|uniref:putative serine-palmitoyl-CoA transferase n=1 Tax=Trypanosoma grayi TaxID=71804 RepID=UPI0004F47B28|nr:putative serine-palmitoyl-CoA transferase [Trypanosoma grayi]KEG10638.1 putative serine-palmitoyl-CoA transferase [Trypanosoma grayi]